ncbi:MAG: hypothetical protein PHP97_01900 [Candidatus Shapirobacteria bacterium]|nr:hypothetical protein [Candidatus Shapirobacteria bacterium]MDD3002982.1 hypothetical protein [Candidatus Shapirobacteria bacterium]MDD4383175.1 hypothetical protein [Candidatus Shapirobacteria bacterium]
MTDFFGLTRSYRATTPFIEFLKEAFPIDFNIYEEKIERQKWLIFDCSHKENRGIIKIDLETGLLDEQATAPIFLIKIKEQMRKTKTN